MRKFRIAIFTGNYNHIRDGVSHTLNRLVAYLESRGIDVMVFGPWTPEPAIQHEGTFVPVYSISAPGRPEYRVSLGFPETEKKVLEDFNPDIIQISTPDLLGYLALRYAQKKNIPVVSSYHTHFSSYLKYYKLSFMEKWLWKYLFWFYSKCEHLYIPSPSILQDLKDMHIPCELRIWSRGVDTSLFSPEKRDMKWRRSLGISDEDKVVAFVSRLVWEKNLEQVARTMQGLVRKNPSVKTLIIGDGPARPDLQERLPDTIFTGHLEGESIAKAYASSDLFFFPSDTESFGNVTLEAMSCGLPAVVADAAGSRSLVDEGVTGYKVQAKDTNTFIRYLDELARDDQKAQAMGKASREKAMKYDWDRVQEELVANYFDVLDRL
ncbi:glycosyltransferase family 1 protein [Balneolaceae bacterium ANBcel3]|nr:glycosyltransferase family 1 protein [Balneolaceae bacterium ANBcel3]